MNHQDYQHLRRNIIYLYQVSPFLQFDQAAGANHMVLAHSLQLSR